MPRPASRLGTVWSLELPTGSMPSGRGFLSGHHYFLPLSSAEVAEVDLTEKAPDRQPRQVAPRRSARQLDLPSRRDRFASPRRGRGVLSTRHAQDRGDRKAPSVAGRPEIAGASGRNQAGRGEAGRSDRAVSPLVRTRCRGPHPRSVGRQPARRPACRLCRQPRQGGRTGETDRPKNTAATRICGWWPPD